MTFAEQTTEIPMPPGDPAPLRITYLHQYFVPPDAPGGTRSYEFARRLVAAGHDVTVITSSAMMGSRYQNLTQITRVKIAGIPMVIIPVPYANEMGFNDRLKAFFRFAALATLEAMRRPTDVILATSTPLTIAIPGILARLRHRVPMVFEVRDLWPELPIVLGFLRNPLMKAAALALEWLAYHQSAHVVALSPDMGAGVVARGIPPERVTIIPNSSDVVMFDVPPAAGQGMRARLGLKDEQPLVVYTGTFGLLNGGCYFVDLAAAMQKIDPDVRFLMIGSGAEREKIIARAHDQGVLDRNLQIWKPISKAEMPQLMAAATVSTSLFIPLPEMWKNSANKFFDGLAAGKPIAINYGGWQADVLRESGAGITLPPDDPARAARMLASLVRSPAWLDHAASAARELARTRFHRDLMFQRLEAVLRNTVGR